MLTRYHCTYERKDDINNMPCTCMHICGLVQICVLICFELFCDQHIIQLDAIDIITSALQFFLLTVDWFIHLMHFIFIFDGPVMFI